MSGYICLYTCLDIHISVHMSGYICLYMSLYICLLWFYWQMRNISIGKKVNCWLTLSIHRILNSRDAKLQRE